MKNMVEVSVVAADWRHRGFLWVHVQSSRVAEALDDMHECIDLLALWVCKNDLLISVERDPEAGSPPRQRGKVPMRVAASGRRCNGSVSKNKRLGDRGVALP